MKVNLEQLEVVHNTDKNRFEVTVEGHTAVTEYMMPGNKIIFSHTEVPVELEGNGIASKLAQTALDYARSENLKVMPLCPYVAAYIRRHPEYRELVLPGYGF